MSEIEQLDIEFFPWPWKSGDLSSFIIDKKGFCSAFTQNEEVIGFFLGDIDSSLQQFHLYKILVSPGSRGRGQSKSLMTQSLQELFNLGVREIYLEVSVDNEAAIGLYKSFGLEVIHRKKRFYSDGSDAFIMLGVVNTNLFA